MEDARVDALDSPQTVAPAAGPSITRSTCGDGCSGSGLSAVATSRKRSACRAQRSLQAPLPASSSSRTCACSSSARSTAPVPAAVWSSTSTEPYGSSAWASDAASARTGTSAEATNGEQRGSRRWCIEAAARLELHGELARDCGGEAPVSLEQLEKRSRRSRRSVVSRTACTEAERARPSAARARRSRRPGRGRGQSDPRLPVSRRQPAGGRGGR